MALSLQQTLAPRSRLRAWDGNTKKHQHSQGNNERREYLRFLQKTLSRCRVVFYFQMEKVSSSVNYLISPLSGSRTPVLIVHGFCLEGGDWVDNFPDSSLAFILADAGYDVWIGNNRGNSWSRRHNNLSIASEEFWDFRSGGHQGQGWGTGLSVLSSWCPWEGGWEVGISSRLSLCHAASMRWPYTTSQPWWTSS